MRIYTHMYKEKENYCTSPCIFNLSRKDLSLPFQIYIQYIIRFHSSKNKKTRVRKKDCSRTTTPFFPFYRIQQSLDSYVYIYLVKLNPRSNIFQLTCLRISPLLAVTSHVVCRLGHVLPRSSPPIDLPDRYSPVITIHRPSRRRKRHENPLSPI